MIYLCDQCGATATRKVRAEDSKSDMYMCNRHYNKFIKELSK